MKKETIKRFFLAPRASRLCGARRAAMTLLTTLLLTLTAQTAWATTENLGGYDFTVGTDTEGDYYVVNSTDALNALASYVNAGNNCSGKRFKMTAPITYNGSANNYTPIGDNSHWFSGTFDGQGNTISGININSSAFYQAIFGFVVGTVKNLVVSDCNIVAQNFIGGIAGQVNSGTIENCHVGSNVSLSAWKFSGGIAGNADGATIKGCTSAATITGVYLGGTNAEYIGGIAGQAAKSGTAHTPYLTDNLFTGAINGSLKDYIGAIVGRNKENVASLTNNVYTSTGFGGIGADGSTTGADGAGAAKAYSITAGTNITLDFAGTATTEYSPNGISVYAAGMKYANALYVGSTATVSLLLSYDSNPTGYSSTTGTLNGTATTGNKDAYTLTMASADAVINVTGTGNSVTLTEANPIAPLTAMSGKQTKVRFTRSGLTAGKYSTICLPYDFTVPSGCTFYKFDGVKQEGDDWVADISTTTGGTANTPYIFTTATAASVTFSNDLVTAAASYDDASANTSVTDWTLQGTYSQITLPNASEYDYGFAAGDGSTVAIGTFVHLVSGASAAPFRAYLKYTGTDTNWAKARTRSGADALPSRIIVRIVGSSGGATAIGTLDTQTGEISTGDWYSLDGRRLQGKPSTKGIFIHNGRKEVLK